MEHEIIETYTFNPEDYHDGRRKSDSMTFRDVVKEFEAASFLSYGMDLTQGNAFDAEQDPYINHAIEGHSRHIFVYGIDSAYMETSDGHIAIDEEKGIYPLTLLIDNSMRNGIIRLATPTSDDEGEEEHVVIDSPKFEYA